jgi:acetate---CoA ligase (ADP-forming)
MTSVGIRGQELVRVLSEPSGVAVVGASSNLEAPAGRPLAYLLRHGFKGSIIAVNPRHSEIAGHPSVPSIDRIPPGSVEAAIVNLPAARVPQAVADLEAISVKVAIVIGSGFEDEESVPRRELLDVLGASDLRLIGPNCVGVMSPGTGAHLNFSSVLQQEEVRTGRVAMVTQSGALGNSLLLSLTRRGAGISHWFSTGDELSTGVLELVAGLLPRDDVDGIGVFLEGITDLDWLEPVRQAQRDTGKPVFVLKAATTDVGRMAAGGHTGRVVGSSDVSSAILSEAGLIEVPTLEALADVLVAMEVLAPVTGDRLGAVSVSGASAVLLADSAQRARTLRMADVDAEAAARLRSEIDPRIHVGNPLDVPFLGETSVFAQVITAMSSSRACDALIAVESSLAHDREQLTDRLIECMSAVPLVLTYLSPDDPIPVALVKRLAEHGIAVIPTPDRAVQALDRVREARGGESAQTPDVDRSSGRVMGMEEIARMPGASALPWARWQVVESRDDARAALRELGAPVVLKAAGRALTHRSEAGAVRLNVGPETIDEAYKEIAAICRSMGDSVVVQEQAPAGFELLLAALRDPEYGPVALLRPGGVLAELLGGQVVLWGRWSRETWLEKISASRLGSILTGYRGGSRYAVDSLLSAIEQTLRLLDENHLAFIEFNPIILTSDNVKIVDALASATGGMHG